MATSSHSKGNYNFKIVLLGEGCVGKTSCVLRYVEDTFNDRHITTLQASFLSKKLNIRGKRVNLSIWDTAGQERFHALGPIYYRDANGAILVYDITDQDSFQKVKNWVKELRKMLGSDLNLAIAGNKTDLEKQRRVDVQMAEDYAKAVGAHHFHTSAKQNKGIEELFLDLSQRMINTSDDLARASGGSLGLSSLGGARGNTVTVVDDSQMSREKSGCCGGGSSSVVTGLPVDNNLAASSQ
ncbi:hypothetical protein TCAL_02549 [Tigriopus californicus]|uniref:Ras-related protein Rab-21 n=1 Tax=Tigriopus californicus TaxID=6832 RepID=A0A553P6A6_TIGCA|nr:ras-related protein Rab-21-like [Tigriopus californicus]TRY73219.1 hypothetical protein TCAL_02549 [Tigriopus californicus]|eukprot:TCALIF_02549-PA protein Name:"Similar to Rab21 Ras-related protein Rab-21 (Mus musculus)" AED:0.13 eAED:0.13 QI:0/0/0/1/1/1/3/0/239